VKLTKGIYAVKLKAGAKEYAMRVVVM